MSQDRSTLPQGWIWTTIGDVVLPRVKQAAPTGNKLVPYIDITSIENARKIIVVPGEVNERTAPTRARQWVEPGDVVVSMTRPNLNAVALVSDKLRGAVASTGFDVLRSIGAAPEWLFFAVQTSRFVDAMCRNIQAHIFDLTPERIAR